MCRRARSGPHEWKEKMADQQRRPFLQVSLGLLASCTPGEPTPPKMGAVRRYAGEADPNANVPGLMSARIVRLLASYPDHLAGLKRDTLVWRDGTLMPIGAGLPARPFPEMLRSATIADQLRQTYEPGPALAPPPCDHSPGRLRNTAFFVKMYGDCRGGDVTPRTRRVLWMPRSGPQPVPVTTVNEVATRLERVIERLETLPDHLKAYLIPS